MEKYNSGYKSFDTFFLEGDSFPTAKPQDLILQDLYLMADRDSGLLICPGYGTTLLMDNVSSQNLIQGKISNHLAFVMVQRGMASYRFSRPVKTIDDSAVPAFFLIDMTKNCNLNCLYCFRNLDKKLPSMKEAQLKNIINALIQYMCKYPDIPFSIQAWGGEPLLKLDLILLMRHMFDSAGLYPEITIETNGTLISKEAAEAICAANIHVGISIDGNSVVHDLQRPLYDGSPSLYKVVTGIRNLRSAGCRNFGTITVVTRNTLEHLEEIIDYFVKNLHLRSIKLNLMRKTDFNQGLAMDLEDIDGYTDRLLNHLYLLYKSGIHLTEQNIRQRLLNLTCRPDNNICNACGCQGGSRMLSIDPEGKVYPCELTDYPLFQMGDIEQSFDEIAKTAVRGKTGYFETRDLKKCRDCPWFYYCKGGCRASSLYAAGHITHIDVTECALNKAIYPRLVQILLNDMKFADFLLRG